MRLSRFTTIAQLLNALTSLAIRFILTCRRRISLPATRHPNHFEDLSPDDFERLVYWLVKRSGEFDEVQ